MSRLSVSARLHCSMERGIILKQTEIDYWMGQALQEARFAQQIGEVPIGAVVVQNGRIIGRGHNLREHAQDGTLHAEVLALQEAYMVTGSWRLEDCDLFVTLEPCPMCAGAMINSRVRTCYFGAMDPKAGVAGSLMNLLEDSRFNHQVQVVSGVREAECGAILQRFFRAIRKRKKAAKQAAKAKRAGQTNVNQV